MNDTRVRAKRLSVCENLGRYARIDGRPQDKGARDLFMRLYLIATTVQGRTRNIVYHMDV